MYCLIIPLICWLSNLPMILTSTWEPRYPWGTLWPECFLTGNLTCLCSGKNDKLYSLLSISALNTLFIILCHAGTNTLHLTVRFLYNITKSFIVPVLCKYFNLVYVCNLWFVNKQARKYEAVIYKTNVQDVSVLMEYHYILALHELHMRVQVFFGYL